MREPKNQSMVLVAPANGEGVVFRQMLIEADGTRFLQALNPAWPKRIVQMASDDQVIGVIIGKWVPEQ